MPHWESVTTPVRPDVPTYIPVGPDRPVKKSHRTRNLILAGVAVLFIASAFAAEDSTPAYVTDPAGLTTQNGDVSQENAIESAQSYLDFGAFSESGLIEQLSSPYGEGFSKADAEFAVSHIKVDWNAEAAESAATYLENGSFSRQGLIEQLESEYGEGFTHAQAVYGVNQTGL